MNLVFIINAIIQIAGITLALYLAFRSFVKRSIQLGDEPTLPQYLTRRHSYALGISAYTLLIAGVYFLLTSIWLPLQPLVTSIVENLSAATFSNLLKSLDGAKLIPLMAAIGFLFLVSWESQFNPLLILRDAIFDAFAFSRKAVEVYNALRNSRLANIDNNIKSQIADRLIIQSIDPEDFEKSAGTVEYKWAHNCVLFDQIQTYANQPSFRRFFTEPSLKWGDICLMYNGISEQVASWKDSEPHYTKTINLIKALDELNNMLCRFLTCLVIFGSSTERDIWNNVKRLGGNINQVRLKHTYKYILIFTAATAVGVMAGREISVLIHNHFIYPSNPLAHFDSATLRWVFYAISIYVLPISLVFIARAYALRTSYNDAQRYYGFYSLAMIVGFITSTAISTLILSMARSAAPQFEFVPAVFSHMRWGILPALMCGFVAYQMDNPANESDPILQTISSALLRFFGWGTLALVIMLYATDNLTIEEPQLRFTIVGTSVLVLGLLGAAARFKTIKSSP